MNETARVVRVSSVAIFYGGAISLLCLISLITWMASNTFVITPFAAILGLIMGVMFLLMGYVLKYKEKQNE